MARAPAKKAPKKQAAWAAKPKKKPAPKALAQKRASLAAGGRSRPGNRIFKDVFDPRDPRPIPTLLSQGKALPLADINRVSLSTPVTPGERMVAVITNTGTGSFSVMVVKAIQGSSAGVAVTMNSFPVVQNSGYTAIRAMKMGVTLRNLTKRLDVGGVVYALNTAQRISLPMVIGSMNSGHWWTVSEEVISMTATTAYQATKLSDGPHTWVNFPLANADYEHFYIDDPPALSETEYARTWSTYPGMVNGFERPMSTVILVFPTTTEVNDYELTVRGHFYLRMPIDHITARLLKSIPTAPPEGLNAMNVAADALSQTARLGEEAGNILSVTKAAGEVIAATAV